MLRNLTKELKEILDNEDATLKEDRSIIFSISRNFPTPLFRLLNENQISPELLKKALEIMPLAIRLFILEEYWAGELALHRVIIDSKLNRSYIPTILNSLPPNKRLKWLCYVQ